MSDHVALLNDARDGWQSRSPARRPPSTPSRRLVAVLNEVRARVRRQGQDGDVPRLLVVALPSASAALDKVHDQVALLDEAKDGWRQRSPARRPLSMILNEVRAAATLDDPSMADAGKARKGRAAAAKNRRRSWSYDAWSLSSYGVVCRGSGGWKQWTVSNPAGEADDREQEDATRQHQRQHGHTSLADKAQLRPQIPTRATSSGELGTRVCWVVTWCRSSSLEHSTPQTAQDPLRATWATAHSAQQVDPLQW